MELKRFGVRVGTITRGTTDNEIFNHMPVRGESMRADKTPKLDPADISAAVHFTLTQPDRANVARLLLVPSAESV